MYRIHSNIHIIDGNAFLINKIRINFSFWKVKFVSTKGVHTRSGPEKLTNPPDANPIQTEPKLQSIGNKFPIPRTNDGGSSGRLLLPNPSNLNPTELYKNPAKSS